MKRFLIAFSAYFSATVAFGAPSSDVKQSQHVTGILIPRIILNDVIMNDDKISGTPGATDKMLAKYDSLAGPLGQTKLTSEDIAQICLASGVITEKAECKERILNPILSKMGKVRFMNVCDGKKSSGGTNHCIDDVFIATKKQNANQYHQDVNISPYTAYGFAIEYAKKQGHDVWCSAEIKDNIVNCTTLDNKDFYSVKFNGTNNTNDSTIEKNLVKGICALFDSKYAIGTFRHQCKLNCGSGTEARKVIQKFGLNVHDGYTTENHCEIYQPTYSANEIKKYPGYEYMSNTFKSVQTVLDSQLIDVLKEYVKLQGIDVQSFECDYSPKKYSEQMSNGMPTSFDDMLSCKINGIDTDFIFDDLFEGKEYERRAGAAALQCILSNGQYGTDRMCRGLTRAQCTEANNKVPGGTRWDEAAELCVLNRADSARKIGNTIQITGGVVLTAGITFATGGGAMIALVAGAGSVAFDAAFIGLERLQILEPASRARAFAEQAQKCEIPIDSKHPSCSQQQVDCAWRAVNDNFARLDEILENLNPDQLSLVSDLMENVTDCLSNDLLSSAVKMSTPKAWDKALNKANAFLLVAGIFIQPEKGVMRITENAPKIARILSRCKMVESVSAKLDNAKYLRIYLNQDISPDDVKALANEFRNNGAYVSTKLYKAEDGTHFMAVAEKDIFKKLEGLYKTTGITTFDDAIQAFLQKFKYSIDFHATSWEDVLFKWNLPVDATDDMIENTYKFMNAEIDMIPENGWHQVRDVKQAIHDDYQLIKRTKPNFGKQKNAVVDNSFAFKKANGVFTDISDEAGRIRIQAMKDKYGIKFHDGSVGIRLPDGTDDIMRQELGKSPIEMRFYDDVRDFMRGYHGIDIGDFDNVSKTLPVSTTAPSTSSDKFRGFNMGDSKSSTSELTTAPSTSSDKFRGFNMGDSKSSTSELTATPIQATGATTTPAPQTITGQKQTTGPAVSTKLTATPENPTKGKFDFNMGKPDNTVSTKPQELPTQTAKPTTETPNPTRTEPAHTVAEKPVVNATKSLENQFNDMFDELWNEARYQAESPLATGFETLAKKFGLEGFMPESAYEAREVIWKIQNQLDETERILKKYDSTALSKTETFERVLFNFRKEKDMAENYFDWLHRWAEF